MRSFAEILAIAADRKGGLAEVEALITPPLDPSSVASIPDDRWLAGFTRAVFSAGFSSQVVDRMWPGFEAAFNGFDIGWCSHIDGERLDALMGDSRIVRNGVKIRSVRDNALFIAETGPLGPVIADWPAEDFIGLLAMLKAKGARLGGLGAQYTLRALGVDGFILSQDVVARLVAEGVVDKAPTSKRDLAATQAAFDSWRRETGRSLTEISRVLAMSVG